MRSHVTIRCVVADDHPAIVSALTDFLTTEGVDVVGKGRDGEEALARIETSRPDVAVVDLNMPRLSGIEVARQAARSFPETGVILYTAHDDTALLVESVDAGARGYVLKDSPLVDLLRAIETVRAGGTYVDPVLAGVIAGSAATAKLPALTRRERDVLRLLADGLSNEEIGRNLFISAETVRTHIRKAMRKLEAETRTQAVATALRQRLFA